MLFSVLIPVYNTSKYLDECIQSVLAQSEKDYEIVLIDDGSTDNSGEICDSYAEKYSSIRVIHKQNEGLMMTRRRGFQEAKGDYFVCLDSDDYLCDDDALAKIKKMIVEKNCDLVVYNYLMEKETREQDKRICLFEKPDGYVFKDSEKSVLYEKLIMGQFFNPIVAKAPKRTIVDIDTDYSVWSSQLYKSQGEDLFQSMPILNNAKRIGYINDVLYYYRWNGGSISRNLDLKFYYAYKTIYQREDEYIDKWNLSQETINKNKLQRVNMITSLIIYSYNHTNDKEVWLAFMDDLASNSFFTSLYEIENKKDILMYYRLVGFFIRHRMKILLQLCIKTVSYISGLKKHKT